LPEWSPGFVSDAQPVQATVRKAAASKALLIPIRHADESGHTILASIFFPFFTLFSFKINLVS
jgi:hypothetical protein